MDETAAQKDSTQAMQNLLTAYDDDELDPEDVVEIMLPDDDTKDLAEIPAAEPKAENSLTVDSSHEAPESNADNLSDHNSVKMDLASDNELIEEPAMGSPAIKEAKVSMDSPAVKESKLSVDSPVIKGTKLEKKPTAASLVSYLPDDAEDEEEESGGSDVEAQEKDGGDDEEESDGQLKLVNYDLTFSQLDTTASDFIGNQFDISLLPPEPTGKCSIRLQDKVENLYKKMKRDGMDMNASIQNRKDFRNPSIYEKLIEFCGIDEKGTNYPPNLYNQSIWGPESYYDELAKAQKIEMDRREKERKDRTKIEFVTGTKKTAATDNADSKKKSKWDTQVTATTTASASTVIPAVGTITKPK